MAEPFDWTHEAATREKVFAVVIFLGMVYVFGTLLWSPQRATTKRLRAERETISVQVDAFEQMLAAQAKGAAAAPPPAEPVDALVDPRFAPYMQGEVKSAEVVMEETVRLLTASSRLKGVELLNFAFGETVSTDKHSEMPFTLRIAGPYGATTRYLAAIEALPLLVIFEGIEVLSQAEQRALLETTLFGRLYTIKGGL